LTEAELANDLDELRKLGLLVPSWLKGLDYPLDPSIAFEQLAGRRRREIGELSDALRADLAAGELFAAAHANFVTQHTNRDVEVLEGRARANQRMQNFNPEKSVWGFVQAGGLIEANADHPDKPHLDRGVAIRYVYPDSYWKKPVARRFFRQLVEQGGALRISPSVPFRLVIFDGEAAVLGIDPEDSSVGAVVHRSPAVVRMAEELFLSYWNQAVDPFEDLSRVTASGILPQEAEFLRLLVRGGTDEQVARRLGVSMRTVRRMAAKLSEQVGASGRFELGVRAAQRGWVD
jgi:DNA-binding CsgD family transcriptional regulator